MLYYYTTVYMVLKVNRIVNYVCFQRFELSYIYSEKRSSFLLKNKFWKPFDATTYATQRRFGIMRISL